MGIPSLNTKADNLVRHGKYIIARCKADPETGALVKSFDPTQESLKKAISAREGVDEVAIQAAALADHRLGAVQRGIMTFGVKAYGYYGNRSSPDFLRLFPVSPSRTATTTPGKRDKVWLRLRSEALDAATHKDLAAGVKLLVAAIDDWSSAQAAADKAMTALQKASTQEAAMADLWHTAVRKLRGELMVLFPRDVKRQQSFMPMSKTSSKAAAPQTGTLQPVPAQ